ncbi:MAG: DUF5805 domain-containing protein [Halodesulfurarchaeum sp.]
MSEQTSERVSVTTYIPAYQKDIWAEHAERLEMSQAEFVRTMVQAGRKGFGESEPENGDSQDATPRGDVQKTVLQAIEAHDGLSFSELLEKLTTDLEAQLDNALLALQEEGAIRHRPREEAYHLDES